MKKILSLLTVLILFSSCSEDISRPNPALQGLKDGALWRAGGSSAVIGLNGNITITGSKQFETLVLEIPSTNAGTYTLGTSAQATFTYANGDTIINYSTANDDGDGQVTIDEYDAENNTITGTFRFNAFNDDATDEENDVVNFQSGNFYKVPIYAAPTN